jgi:hypothetical protein
MSTQIPRDRPDDETETLRETAIEIAITEGMRAAIIHGVVGAWETYGVTLGIAECHADEIIRELLEAIPGVRCKD